jgi:hypothetical protein
MRKLLVVSLAVLVPGIALACGGAKSDCGHCAHKASDTTAMAAVKADPAECAKKAELMGGSCSYTTGMMAQRVLADGKAWSYSGTLVAASEGLTSHVAAPYVVGPEKVRVVANEVLEGLTSAQAQAGRVSLEGKLLEVDGVKYYVLTGYKVLTA